MEVKKISWDEYEAMVDYLARQLKEDLPEFVTSIYGVPRGGLTVAVSLSHKIGLPIVSKFDGIKTLIVDDICDSGRTMLNTMPFDCLKASLFYRGPSVNYIQYSVEDAEDFFIQFPWETDESAKVDYME